jgi:hypothetical protein
MGSSQLSSFTFRRMSLFLVLFIKKKNREQYRQLSGTSHARKGYKAIGFTFMVTPFCQKTAFKK